MPTWKEDIQRTYKLSLDQVEKYLTTFFNELTLKGENPIRAIQQTQSHFINWLKIQLEKKPNGKDQPITTSHKRPDYTKIAEENSKRIQSEKSKSK